MSYSGWAITKEERARLLALFPPAYPDVVAHHVTLKFPAKASDPLPTDTRGKVVGIADNGEAVQALVVEIAGTTDRPGGGTYHITWSLDKSKGAKPVHSNDVIASGKIEKVPVVPVTLVPKFFD